MGSVIITNHFKGVSFFGRLGRGLMGSGVSGAVLRGEGSRLRLRQSPLVEWVWMTLIVPSGLNWIGSRLIV